MKRKIKQIIARLLGWQVRRLRAKRDFLVVAVVGSVGKTSTKRAIAQYIGHEYRVRYQVGNYNDILSVPFVFFGLRLPHLYNPFAWLWRFLHIEYQLQRDYPYDVVVLELGTDGPGQIAEFAAYLRPDVAVVTAIAAEHMEFFNDIESVAEEELAIASYAERLIINIDDVAQEFRAGLTQYQSYGTSREATVWATSSDQAVDLHHNQLNISVQTELIGVHMHKVLIAAYLVGEALNLDIKDKVSSLAAVTAMAGRMNILKLASGVIAIDDSYNASPDAVVAALDTLYAVDAPRKIAVIGNMNEMGEHSQNEHERIGNYCDNKQLEEVIVIGPDAKTFLADAARAKGNLVIAFDSPYAVADHLKSKLGDGLTILFKGSQNGVFLEEAIKPLLAKPEDAEQLVRQSPAWLRKKSQLFS